MRTKIYIADVSDMKNEETFKNFYLQIPKYRQDKVDKYIYCKDKILSLGAGILLKRVLETEGIYDAEFSKTAEGKPFLKNYPKVYFNLSHSGERVMCVISSQKIGCDVEKISTIDLKIAERFFHDVEYNYLKSMSDEQLQNEFYRIWTMKESYVKAVGRGFYMPINSFSVVAGEGLHNVIESDTEGDFQFIDVELEDEYKYSCCVQIEGVHQKIDKPKIEFVSL